MENKETITITVQIPRELDDRLEKVCEIGLKKKAVIAQAIELYLTQKRS